jgi:hypothetical protein
MYPTIQDGLNPAAPKDTVLLQPAAVRFKISIFRARIACPAEPT